MNFRSFQPRRTSPGLVRFFVLLGLSIAVAQGWSAQVTIHGREVRIDGVRFQMRGICYNPVPIGHDARRPPHSDFYTRDWRALHLRDLPLMRALGVNCVRVYGWKPGADHSEFLDLAWNNGVDPIRVLVSPWVDPYTDWNSAAAVAALQKDWAAIAREVRAHPATLGYLIGNELNQAFWNRSLPRLWPAVNSIAAAIRQEDTNHLVTTALSDQALLEHIRTGDRFATNLNAWCVQTYRGTGFKTLFADYAAASGKPLFVSEFGFDAYHARFRREYADNASLPADGIASLWGEIAAATNIVSGGAVFEWTDEWWKHGRPASQDPGGWPNGAFPDGQADEEWWGLHRVVKGRANEPDRLEPRAAVETLRRLWAKPSVPTP